MSEMNFCPADDEMRNIVSDSTFEVVDILCQHEDTTYTKRDWVAMARQEQVLIPDVLHSATKMTTGPLHYHLTLNESLSKVTADCRQDMFKWYMEMVEYVGLQQTTIEITLSILDRFLMTPSGYMARHDRRAFQLASIAAFYTAVKVHEPLALSPAMVSQLTNGLFTACDIELEEAELLEALQWRVNPPTATEFCHLLVQLLPAHYNHLTQCRNHRHYTISEQRFWSWRSCKRNWPWEIIVSSRFGLRLWPTRQS